eukprot:1143305-Pelagomonas_calceolata.AAC.6
MDPFIQCPTHDREGVTSAQCTACSPIARVVANLSALEAGCGACASTTIAPTATTTSAIPSRSAASSLLLHRAVTAPVAAVLPAPVATVPGKFQVENQATRLCQRGKPEESSKT